MTVHDAFHQKKAAYRSTPLILQDPASTGFLFMYIWLRGMTVHDAFHQKKAAYRSTPLILQDPASTGFLFMYIWLRGMTVHDAFHQKKAAYRSTPLIPQDPASAGFLFGFSADNARRRRATKTQWYVACDWGNKDSNREKAHTNLPARELSCHWQSPLSLHLLVPLSDQNR